jgi:predicted transcriptional regulator
MSVQPLQLLIWASSITAAYVSKTAMPAPELPGFIRTVHQVLAAISREEGSGKDPAVSLSESITPNHLVCLEDGQKVALLGRHLRQAHDMSPRQYRIRWSLPADYPMVAAGYSKLRSKVAKQNGLGSHPRAPRVPPRAAKAGSRAR